MAGTQARPTGTLSRPNNFLILPPLVVVGLVGYWLTMFEPVFLSGIPGGYTDIIKAGQFPNGTRLVRDITGIGWLDAAVAQVTASFLPGAAAWDMGITLHQVHFLVQFAAIMAIFNVEACRIRNAGTFISLQPIWVLGYQTMTGALVLPTLAFFSLLRSGKNSWYASGRAVPMFYAKALLPAVVLGYLLPTAAMYWPTENIKFKSIMTVVWQPSPLYPNLLLWIFSLFVSRASRSPSPSKSSSKPADVWYLKTLYKVMGTICLINHVVTLYLCFSSPDPVGMLRYMFIPNKQIRADSVPVGLLYIFQWDWIFTAAGSFAWAVISIADVKRLSPDSTTLSALDTAWEAVKLVVMSAIVGPGTIMCVVWGWREEKLVRIEQRALTGKVK